ncbi:MAG: cyclic nucleotide-binding domain-containing protein [Chitinivibrionales bacterium]|nr:cyclic nucleotide-binding domain-containing protein [Chitinivibrionales bacterium]MBD3395395.1 cyclic nucleotide-binding domain-containing protein [Chitinivibrionales bacterium]
MSGNVYDSLHVLENVIFLKKSPLFSSMKTGDLRAVAEIAEEMTFSGGDEIVRENDVGDSMYIIKEGSVAISKEAGDRRLELARLKKGDCFGDMAIFDAEVRSASVIARDTCTLLRIDSDALKDVLIDYPSIAIELLKIFVKRLRAANETIQGLSASGG